MLTHTFRGVTVALDANATTGLQVIEVASNRTILAGRQSGWTTELESSEALAGTPRSGSVALLGSADVPAGIATVTVPFIDGQHGEYVTLERAVASVLELADRVGTSSLLLPAMGCTSGWAVDRAAYVVLNTIFRHVAETGTHMTSIAVQAEGPLWDLAFQRVTRTMLGTAGASAAHG
jgi:hypothetical protein